MMSKLFQKVDTVFVSAENMTEMVTWYEQVLGLSRVWENEFITILSTGEGTPVTILDNTTPDTGHPLFNFLTPDVNMAHAHLKKSGARVEEIIDQKELKTFDFFDPEGNRLNVCYLKEEG